MSIDTFSMLVGVGIFTFGLLIGWSMSEDKRKRGDTE